MKNEAFLTEKLNRMKLYENELYGQGFRYIVGADEAGRGPLAGPVVAAALVLPADFSVLGVDDSKKLSEKKRGELFETIMESALACGIGIVDNLIIDEINILEATKTAMRTAITEAGQSLVRAAGSPPDHALIDAMTLEGIGMPQKGIVKGDEKSVSIAAASIIAKVTRDRMMYEFHEKYPYYGFDKNKGYGTKAHYEGILKYGTCEIHRKTFLRKLNANSPLTYALT